MAVQPAHIIPDRLSAENIFLSTGGKDILRGASVTITKGHITGLLGRNGAGKSSMLQAIFGTRKAQDCDVFINGAKQSKLYTRVGLVSYLPQRAFMPPYLTPRVAARDIGANLDHILHLFPGLEKEKNTRAGNLSGGTERLFSVSMILLSSSRFILLDEPFSHIMPAHIERLRELIISCANEKGIIITDHMYGPVLEISTEYYLMKEGKSIYLKNADDLVLHGYLSGSHLQTIAHE